MISDFYYGQLFSGKTPVKKVLETEHVLAYHHTKQHAANFVALQDTAWN